MTLIFLDQIYPRHQAGAGEIREGGEEEQPRGGGEAGLRHGGGGRQELRVGPRPGQGRGERCGTGAGKPGQEAIIIQNIH